MSLFVTSNRLITALLQLILILFLITASHGYAIQQGTGDPIDSSDLDDASRPLPITARTSMEERSTSDSSNFTFPTAFDSMADNFTASSCPQFFTDFLANPTYQSCYPISLLLENSNSFFKDLASSVTLDEVLDTACTANVTACSTFMNTLASNLTSDSNCGADYKLGNPVVTQAYDGMLSYEPIAKVACLDDPTTGDYCFTEAATNSTNISNYYLYFIALGNSLPTSGQPDCNECTQATMAVFADAAVYKDSPLVDTYIPAAETINIGCGPNFVNASVDVGSESRSSTSSKSASVLAAQPPSVATMFAYLLPICVGLLTIL